MEISNKNILKKPELLAPAGDMEKLKMAVLYGADAVYLGSSDFSLRAQSRNFDGEQLAEAVEFVHAHGKKAYLTVNVYAHEDHIEGLEDLLTYAGKVGVDAFIISDPGIFAMAKRLAPNVALHISTQASVTNSEAVNFWEMLGAERVILGREVSLANCGEMSKKINIELEIFVHGAVCMSYSGRCLLSNFMTKRNANMGDCSQPCRWEYRLEESKRPGSFFPIEEDRWGSYIFNSKDMCLIKLLPEIVFAGVSSLKIEGRMKSVYYVSNVVRVYRQGLDACYKAYEQYMAELPEGAEPNVADFREKYYTFDEKWQEELEKISHRHYFTGFAEHHPNENGYVYDTTYSFRGYDFAGVILGYDAETKRLQIEQRNHLALGDEVEIISPVGEPYPLKLYGLWGNKGDERQTLPHAKEICWIACEKELPVGSIIRRPIKDSNVKASNDISLAAHKGLC